MNSDYTTQKVWAPRAAVEQKAVDEFVQGLDPIDSLVDVPCGAAKRLPIYQKHGIRRARGIEPSEELAAASNRAGLPTEQGDIWDLPDCSALVCLRVFGDKDELADWLEEAILAAVGPILIAVRIGEGLSNLDLGELAGNAGRKIHPLGSVNDGVPGVLHYVMLWD